ncbi:MAG: hypothetical protein ACW981_04395 [Candidatus Hodarchaeales archaeon]|jgi:hypothetical protein
MSRVCVNCGIKFVGITCHACGKNNNYRVGRGKVDANQMAASIITDFNIFATKLVIPMVLVIIFLLFISNIF